jgi:predicted dehydrogenase
MEKYRTAIIGCGFAAHGVRAQGKHMASLIKMKDEVEMVAFYDTIEERAIDSAKEFGSRGLVFAFGQDRS